MNRGRGGGSLPPALLAAALLAAAGCVPLPPLRSGPEIPRGKVEALRPGASTREELLSVLGAPVAVLSRDRSEPVPRVPAYGATGFAPAAAVGPLFGSVPADPAAAFAVFDDRRTAGPDDRVWLYRRTGSTKLGVFLLLAIYERGWTWEERLWVLVDERRGVVKDLYGYP